MSLNHVYLPQPRILKSTNAYLRVIGGSSASCRIVDVKVQALFYGSMNAITGGQASLGPESRQQQNAGTEYLKRLCLCDLPHQYYSKNM